ncbi:MAG TPA: phospholipid carrier-dependent glycosyltransferase [Spongiibacteraceae bacterium]|nr:phospholipid carrier-dependent glycosyltransferase [Spongiibacteraceae bacterium]
MPAPLPWQSSKAAIGWLLILGLITRFAVLAHSPMAAMDEIYFSQYLSSYFTHHYYFDIHPPLGKLLVAGFAALFNFTPVPLDTKFDAGFVGNNALLLRFLPCLAGTLLPPLLFTVARALGLSLRAGLLAGVFVVLDNSLIAHSQFLYFDNFLLLFGFAALWLALRYGQTQQLGYAFGAGVLAGLSASVKWTGLTFLLLAGLAMVWQSCFIQRAWRRALIASIVLAIGAAIAYALIFDIHFALLPLSGPGDNFMPLNFQQTLIGNPHYRPEAAHPAFLQTLIDTNKEMFATNQRVTGGHPYGSSWWQWPLAWKPIYYLRDATTQPDGNAYSIGNFVLWWSASVAVLIAIGALIAAGLCKRAAPAGLLFILGGYLLNWLPFAGIHRVMFLYHYYCAYLFALLLLAVLLDRFTGPRTQKIFIALALAMFIYLLPLTYGLPFAIGTYEQTWLPAWR